MNTPASASARPHAVMIAAAFALLFIGLVAGCSRGGAGPHAPQPALKAFASEADLRAFLTRKIRRDEAQFEDAAAPAADAAAAAAADAAPLNAPMIAPAPNPPDGGPSVTNNQVEGVDEGDIVKARGDLLVILRRGRLFTVSLAGSGMHPVDWINAYPPGVDARDDWYDEMLVTGSRVVVIGYSYGRGGVEINRFRLSPEGRLAFEDAYHLKANDYYSSRNYASRLVGTKLVFYSPLSLWTRSSDPLDALPAMRRWEAQGSHGAFHRIAGAGQVFIPQALRDDPDARIDSLHTVSTCDLAAPVLDCHAISVLGLSSRSFYVSQSAVYVWVSDQRWGERERPAKAFIYRLPFAAGPPTAAQARGAPTDQFSFREADGGLSVLIRPRGGDAMWRPEFSEGAVALVTAPLSSFGDGSHELPASAYRFLPKPTDGPFQNHFVGGYVLYGSGGGWDRQGDEPTALFAVPVRGGAVARLNLAHAVDRIEALGGDALVVGGAQDLHFQTVELSAAPRLGDDYILPAATQGETRSHGFFFRPDTPDGASGLLGLPVARPGRPAYQQLFEASAAMVFLKRQDRHLSPFGELPAAQSGFADDACVASCVDWYGNARPIFLGGRIFALLGYELVEGEAAAGGMRERGRLNFAPGRGRPQ